MIPTIRRCGLNSSALITELKKACNFAPESRESAKMDYLNEILDEVSRRIVNEIQDVSRVVYDISGKPPATIEWE